MRTRRILTNSKPNFDSIIWLSLCRTQAWRSWWHGQRHGLDLFFACNVFLLTYTFKVIYVITDFCRLDGKPNGKWRVFKILFCYKASVPFRTLWLNDSPSHSLTHKFNRCSRWKTKVPTDECKYYYISSGRYDTLLILASVSHGSQVLLCSSLCGDGNKYNGVNNKDNETKANCFSLLFSRFMLEKIYVQGKTTSPCPFSLHLNSTPLNVSER